MDVEEYNITQKENRERVWITEKGEQKKGGHKGNPQKGITRVPLGDGEKKGGQKRARVLTCPPLRARVLPCPSLFLKASGNVVNRAEDGGEKQGDAEAEKNNHRWLNQCN